MADTCDVLVIGCGAIGAATAYYLSKAGMKVIAVDRGDVASGTSSACDGNVLVVDKQPGFDAKMAYKSQELYKTLQDELSFDFEYRQLGSVLAVENQTQVDLALEWVKLLADSGIAVRYIGHPDVHQYEPKISGDIVGLVECDSDSSLNPIALVYAYVNAARKKGAMFKPLIEVNCLLKDRSGRIAGADTSAGRILAPNIVLAAGVWTPAIARTCGIDVPIKPRKGHILVAERTFGVGTRKVQEFGYLMAKFSQASKRDVEPEMDRYGIAMVFEPTPHGNFLIGSSREFAGFDTTCSMKVLELLARRALRFFPCIRDVRVIRAYAGLRPYTPDHLPIISDVELVPGLYIAAGHEGDGIGLAPITGVLVSAMLAGNAPVIPLEPLKLSRFSSVKA
ncbi:MAG: NAD(P)/FAD-dependent oxidoreductase [Bacillota bacterium]|jgi:glycine/D-amino acid oxidase-like deaminating enzyme